MTNPNATFVCWHGELLWPRELAESLIIDVSAVTAIGTWTYEWFRQRPNLKLIGASRGLQEQLRRAEIPVLFYRSLPECHDEHGVSGGERAMLWEGV